MKGRAGWTALVIAMLSSFALPVLSWAGSSQATLAVAVVVPARCAVRTPASVTGLLGTAAIEPVAMRCTKGTLPIAGGPASPTAVAPRISRDLVAVALPAPAAPRPVSEVSALPTNAPGPHLVITVNF
jgi:hypothetical protein